MKATGLREICFQFIDKARLWVLSEEGASKMWAEQARGTDRDFERCSVCLTNRDIGSDQRFAGLRYLISLNANDRTKLLEEILHRL